LVFTAARNAPEAEVKLAPAGRVTPIRAVLEKSANPAPPDEPSARKNTVGSDAKTVIEARKLTGPLEIISP
jgi:hypothetical protein